jgi:hypothetical protein
MNITRRSRLILLISSIVLAFGGCGEDRTRYANALDVSGQGVNPQQNIWIYDTPDGKDMIRNNFIYIPGGFDVDGDGKNEGGFWLAKYEAKSTSQEANLSVATNIKQFIADNFQLFNTESKKFDGELNVSRVSFLNASMVELMGDKKLYKVNFSKGFGSSSTTNYISSLEAAVALKSSQVNDKYTIQLPDEKQWMQLVQLVVNNPKNWTSGKVGEGKLFQGKRNSVTDSREFVIANSLLGVDKLVPKDYSGKVSDLSGNLSEWTSGIVYYKDRFLTGNQLEKEFSDFKNGKMPLWWKPKLKDGTVLKAIDGVGMYHDGSSLDGANDTIAVTSMSTGDVDHFASVARGGSSSLDDDNLAGISAAKLNYGLGYQGPSVGFRAASKYLY